MISQKMTDVAILNAIQNARKQGFKIIAKPGPPTTFRFEPPA